jgi:hypothetical protein
MLAVACASTPPQEPDAAVVTDAAVVVDADIDAGETSFGEPCTRHAECDNGYCVEGAGGGGGQCSRACNDDCPTGWDCREVALPGDTVRLCIPTITSHCVTCANDGECAGGACLQLDGGGRCAPDCTDSSQCPDGYECAADAAATHAGMFCQPVTRSCTCNTGMNGATRTCTVANAMGTCFGTETCNATTGWSACSASAATTE